MDTATTVLRVVRDVARYARDRPSVDGLAQTVVDLLSQRLGFEHCAILTLDRHGTLTPLALQRPDDDPASLVQDKMYVGSRLARTRRGVTTWVARHGTSVRTGDVRDDERYLPMRDDIRSELCVPIRVLCRTFGVLNTESTRASIYTRRDEELLEIVALQVAAGLASAHEAPRAALQESYVTVCADCRQYRAGDGVWRPLESLIERCTDLSFSHGLCPTCLPRWR